MTGPFGLISTTQVDAHMKFARKTINSDSDVSFVMKATSAGRRKQLSLLEYNQLELRESAKTELVRDNFLRTYGEYIIVGFIYGGEILFETTNTARSLEDKLDIEAGMGYVGNAHCNGFCSDFVQIENQVLQIETCRIFQ